MPKVLTASRVRVAAANEANTMNRCGACPSSEQTPAPAQAA